MTTQVQQYHLEITLDNATVYKMYDNLLSLERTEKYKKASRSEKETIEDLMDFAFACICELDYKRMRGLKC